MPAPAMFDTHRYITKLTAVGMPEQQAEVLAEEQKQLLDTHLATKDDVKEATKELATKAYVNKATEDMATKAYVKVVVEKATEDMATKTYVKEVVENATKGMATREDVADSKVEILKWMGGSTVALIGVILGVLPWLVN